VLNCILTFKANKIISDKVPCKVIDFFWKKNLSNLFQLLKSIGLKTIMLDSQ